MANLTLKISQMHCASCALRIDGDLEDTPGVTESQTNFAKALTQVKYDDSQLSADDIIQVVKDAGYSAEAVC